MEAGPPVRRMVVGITGASGTVYGIRVLEVLRAMQIESHLVISKAGDQTRALETDLSAAALRALADKVYAPGDIAAAISSGSFQTMGMIVAPCSVRTLSEIATGVTSSLVARAADVCLKERRRVVLMFRETPLHAGHIKSMLAVTEMGAIVAVPVPAFYARPAHGRRHRQPFGRARARSVRARHQDISAMDRSVRRRVQAEERGMMKRRTAIATLVASGVSVPAAFAQAQGVHVLDSAPKAHAQIGRRSSEFFVRFDRPVDHIKSTARHQAGRSRDRDASIRGSNRRRKCCSRRRPPCRRATTCCTGRSSPCREPKAIEGDIPFKVSD